MTQHQAASSTLVPLPGRPMLIRELDGWREARWMPRRSLEIGLAMKITPLKGELKSPRKSRRRLCNDIDPILSCFKSFVPGGIKEGLGMF